MKAFYLAASAIFTVLILIIAFGNIDNQFGSMYILLFEFQANATILILFMSLLGIVTGMFYHAFIAQVLASGDDEEEL